MALFSKFVRNEAGVFSIHMGMFIAGLLPMVVFAIDYSRVWLAEGRLQDAVYLAQNVDISDAKSLKDVENAIELMISTNYRSETLTVDYQHKNGAIYVTASDEIKTPAFAAFGYDSFKITADNNYKRQISNRSARKKDDASKKDAREAKRIAEKKQRKAQSDYYRKRYKAVKDQLKLLKRHQAFRNNRALVKSFEDELKHLRSKI